MELRRLSWNLQQAGGARPADRRVRPCSCRCQPAATLTHAAVIAGGFGRGLPGTTAGAGWLKPAANRTELVAARWVGRERCPPSLGNAEVYERIRRTTILCEEMTRAPERARPA